MKKFSLIAMLILSSSISYGKDYVFLKYGINTNPTLKVEKNHNGKKTENNFSIKDKRTTIGAEYLKELNQNIDMGIGIDYKKAFDFKNNVEMEGYLIPIYLIARTDMMQSNIKPFLIFKYGITIPDIDVNSLNYKKQKGGSYFAWGIGVDIKDKILFELAYTNSKFNIEYTEYKDECSYSKLDLNIGYKFEF